MTDNADNALRAKIAAFYPSVVEVFVYLEAECNGEVSSRQLLNAWNECGLQLAESEFSQLLQIIRDPHTGRLSYPTFLRFLSNRSEDSSPSAAYPISLHYHVWNQQMGRLRQKLRERYSDFRSAFLDMDSNRDGLIYEHNFRHVASSLGLHYSDTEWKALWGSIDPKWKNCLDYAHFVKFLQFSDSCEETMFELAAEDSTYLTGQEELPLFMQNLSNYQDEGRLPLPSSTIGKVQTIIPDGTDHGIVLSLIADLAYNDVHGLQHFFRHLDPTHSGTVTLAEFRLALRRLGHFDVSMATLQACFADAKISLQENDRVPYHAFVRLLEATAASYSMHDDGSDAIERKYALEALLQAAPARSALWKLQELKSLFQHLTADLETKQITPSMLKEGLALWGVTLSLADATQLVHSYSEAPDRGSLHFADFARLISEARSKRTLQERSASAERGMMTATAVDTPPVAAADPIAEIIDRIRVAMSNQHTNLRALFRKMDVYGTCTASPSSFSAAIEECLHISLTPLEIAEILKHYDYLKDGNIHYFEFMKMFPSNTNTDASGNESATNPKHTAQRIHDQLAEKGRSIQNTFRDMEQIAGKGNVNALTLCEELDRVGVFVSEGNAQALIDTYGNGGRISHAAWTRMLSSIAE